MSWPFLIELEIASWPLWKKVESPMKTTCLLVMNGSMPRPVRAAQPHAAVVVHEVLVRLEHQHGVAAGVAVEDEVDRLAAMRLAHVVGVAELPLDFAEDAGGIAMRAAGAEGRRARREVDLDGGVLPRDVPARARCAPDRA